MYIYLTVDEAIDYINYRAKDKSYKFSVEYIKRIKFQENKECAILVCSKFFYIEGFIYVTIILDNSQGKTDIDIISCDNYKYNLLLANRLKKKIESIFADTRIE